MRSQRAHPIQSGQGADLELSSLYGSDDSRRQVIGLEHCRAGSVSVMMAPCSRGDSRLARAQNGHLCSVS